MQSSHLGTGGRVGGRVEGGGEGGGWISVSCCWDPIFVSLVLSWLESPIAIARLGPHPWLHCTRSCRLLQRVGEGCRLMMMCDMPDLLCIQTLLISPRRNFPCSFTWVYWESVVLLREGIKMSIPSDRHLSFDFSNIWKRDIQWEFLSQK